MESLSQQRKMMPIDGGLTRLRHNTPEAHGETLSRINLAPPPFSLNQNSAVCLPLVSESRRLIWVHSNQIDLQLDGAAELEKAFDMFPYLTQKQTDALAHRCSLHPDQVRVWFMVQRLHYGISWDYKDIHTVRRRMAEGRETGEQLESQVKQDTGRNVEEGQRNAPEKPNWGATEADVMDNKRRKREEESAEKEGEVEVRSDKANSDWPDSLHDQKKDWVRENTGLLPVQERPARNSFKVPPLADNNQTEPVVTDSVVPLFAPNIHMSPLESVESNAGRETGPEVCLEGQPHAFEFQNPNDTTATDLGQLQELLTVNADPVLADGSPTSAQQQQQQQQHTAVVYPSLPNRSRFRTKTEKQLAMMKAAFTHCQYPDEDDYTQLSTITGVPRYMLVQWYGDMRYYIKRGKPGWMSKEQHSHALANVMYRQCLKAISKSTPLEEDVKTTPWKERLAWSESFDTGKSEPGPPQENE